MESFIAIVLAKSTPSRLLPTGTKLVNGERRKLNVNERREFLERNLCHRINQFLDSYSPYRLLIEKLRRNRLKRSQDRFYRLIGEIALTHAGTEQDLKNVLIVDWEIPKKFERNGKQINLDKLHGKVLRKEFLKKLEEHLIPEEHLGKYKELCLRFWKLSDRRNDTLKAIYAFNHTTAEISIVHEKNHANFDSSIGYEEFLKSWMPKIEIDELQKLLNDLSALRQEFMNLRAIIFREKLHLHSELCSEIGESYPLYATKNPYLYKAQLEKEVEGL
ncbi:MAG: hypothetical protein AB8C40_10400 [Gammaproteobacteria bacterium]